MTSLRAQATWMTVVLCLTLAKGVVELYTRPWSIYDEAGHLEYVRYVTEHRALPAPTSLDYSLRQRLAEAAGGGDCSHDRPGSIKGCLGAHQLDEWPAFYVAQALVQSIGRPSATLAQLRLARAVSLAFFVLTIVTAFAATRLGFPREPLLAVAVPSLMAVLPGFASTMIVVNNDVIAAFAGSALVAAAVLLVVRGLGPGPLLLLLAAGALCAASKATCLLLAPAVVIALWLSLPVPRAWSGAVLLGLAAGGAAVSFDLRGSAYWLKPHDDHVDRVRTAAPLGAYVFDLEPGQAIRQPLSPSQAQALRGRRVTLGAFVRAPDGPALAWPPTLEDGRTQPPALMPFGPEWTFVSTTAARVDEDATDLRVRLAAPPNARVQFDAVTLARGRRAAGPPEFASPDGAGGSWGGRPFRNGIRNGSAETGWPLVRESANQRIRMPGGGLNSRLQDLYTWRVHAAHHRKAALRFLQTFWRPVAWGIPDSTGAANTVLIIATVLGLGGLLLAAARSGGRRLPAEVVLFHLVAAGSAMLMAALRTEPPLDGQGVLMGARYAFPAIIPMATLLLIGLAAWVPRRLRPYALAALVVALYVSDLPGMLSG